MNFTQAVNDNRNILILQGRGFKVYVKASRPFQNIYEYIYLIWLKIFGATHTSMYAYV